MDDRIAKFVRRHHVMTLATRSPWVAHVFYAWTGAGFVFASDGSTRHGAEMTDGPVAAAIALETRVVGRLQGVQMEGTVRAATDEERRAYVKRFPFSAAIELTLWTLTPSSAKLTDNTLGFGKKITWNASEDVSEVEV